MGEKLSEAQLDALRGMQGCHSYHPETARRDLFRRLTERGLARSTGPSHGGEGFEITEAGRSALRQAPEPTHVR